MSLQVTNDPKVQQGKSLIARRRASARLIQLYSDTFNRLLAEERQKLGLLPIEQARRQGRGGPGRGHKGPMAK